MLSLRFQRVGKKHQPSFRLVVAEKRSKLNGPSIERLGFYNPLFKKYNLNKERINYWLKVGAKPTATVHNLLVKAGLIAGPKVKIKIKSNKKESENSSVSGSLSLGSTKIDSEASSGESRNSPN